MTNKHDTVQRLTELIDSTPGVTCRLCGNVGAVVDWLVHNGVSVADDGTSTETEAHGK